jgi:glycosyltransferase involved in cell wall biosynthesis
MHLKTRTLSTTWPVSRDSAPTRGHITVVAHDIGGVGGMELVLSELISGLLDDGYHLTVISRTCEVQSHDRLRWIHVPGPGRPFPLAYPWFFIVGSLITWRKRSGPVLSTGAIVANHVDWIAVHFCHHATDTIGLSRVSQGTIWYRVSAWLSHGLKGVGERFCYSQKRTGGLIGVSRGVSAEVAEHFPEVPTVTIPNGVSLERFHPDHDKRADVRQRHGLRADELVALFVGSEWERKGLRVAIDALASAPHWKLLVVGHGNVASYRAHARATGVEHRVEFVGTVSDPAPYYCASDAFVLPTSYETFSLVTYEAAATGVPLLVTPVNGVTDLLVDGRNGWFIDRDPTDIAHRLQTLGQESRLRTEMGAAGRKAVEEFTWRRMVSAYRDVLDRRESRESAVRKVSTHTHVRDIHAHS